MTIVSTESSPETKKTSKNGSQFPIMVVANSPQSELCSAIHMLAPIIPKKMKASVPLAFLFILKILNSAGFSGGFNS
ncbi:hypothetical protein [Roseibium suaedae]|uniref:hypothetical protein n=1 Tax=Roseibium suaedae TaxID=735517 RepID=UPI0011147537|nr:hypothetical protein [Roseibium suaedae]